MTNAVMSRLFFLLGGAGLTLACSGSPEVVTDNGGFVSGGNDGAAARGGAVSLNPTGGVGAGGASQAGNGETCATSSAEVALTPLDMALVVDTSYSMDSTTSGRTSVAR